MMVASAWPSRRVLAQFAALALAWGSSFFFIKVALRGLSVPPPPAGCLKD
jgi:hypothetical protein